MWPDAQAADPLPTGLAQEKGNIGQI